MSEHKLVHLTRKRRCDFCGKTEDDVSVIIVAPENAADICDECVGVCVEVLASRKNPAQPEAAAHQERGG